MRFACCVAVLLAVQMAWAVVVKPLSIEELTGRADIVVRGSVASKSCQRDAAGRIYTKLELIVSEIWKGQPQSETLTIVHGGGILGEEKVVVSGQAEYLVDEEVVLFLVRNVRGEGVTVGLAQGKFEVRKDPDTGDLFAQNAFHGRASPTLGSGSGGERLSLAALKKRVQGVQP